MKKSPHDVIKTVLITEKTTDLAEQEKYFFQAYQDATKIEIAKAVEELFDVTVKSVNTINCKGKPKRVGRTNKMGRRTNWKKAIVTLSEGSIDVLT